MSTSPANTASRSLCRTETATPIAVVCAHDSQRDWPRINPRRSPWRRSETRCRCAIWRIERSERPSNAATADAPSGAVSRKSFSSPDVQDFCGFTMLDGLSHAFCLTCFDVRFGQWLDGGYRTQINLDPAFHLGSPLREPGTESKDLRVVQVEPSLE